MVRPIVVALAVGTLGSWATARNGEEWSSLDRELARLATTTSTAQGGGLEVHGYVRSYFAYDQGAPTFAGLPNDDLSGVVLDRARLDLTGMSGDYHFRTRVEAADGTVRLLDAYGSMQCNEYVRTTMGRFQTPLYWNGLVDPRDQLFILRTSSDEFWIGGRPGQTTNNIGVMLDGSLDRFHWAVAVQNGVDSIADEHAFTLRGRFDVLGAGIGLVEGAYSAPQDAALSVGAGWHDDGGAVDAGGNSADGDVIAVDAQFAYRRFAANAEVLDYSDGSVNVYDFPDSTPWAVTASFMAIEQQCEVAARYQDVDTPTNLRDVTLGVNWYAAGHAAKWQLNVVRTFSDADNEETTLIALGLTVGV